MRPDGYLLDGELDVDAVVAEVARGFRVEVDEILGPSRARRVCVARACAMAVVRVWTDMSWSAIGRAFDRDHTTVMHNVDRVMADPELSHSVQLVAEELSPPPRLFDLAEEV